MLNLANKIFLAVAIATGAIAQVTETATPNAEEYAQIKSDIISYHSALTTQPLYISAQSYIQEHSTTVPPIGLQLYTKSWSQGVSSLNALIATSFPTDFPTVVSQLYVSALKEQANIINSDITQDDATTTSGAMVTGTGEATTTNNTSFGVTNMPSQGTATGSATPSASSGAANAQLVVNGIVLAFGLGVAALV